MSTNFSEVSGQLIKEVKKSERKIKLTPMR